ncbi:hypothetical protein COU37_03345 [Candidatus Micrarchaeota archaeon CG10_big_fil_rev_8_21_14_0_10_45_29]|nr:MAG: hypothetical protein COU37_03345 [Candidatus Micrarchaeota archaeon CG10_big_fil_rev_8_21_14_0_10_45_29]
MPLEAGALAFLTQIEPIYIIAAVGVVYSVSVNFIMNKIVDRKKMKEIQEESKRLQKELSDASKSGDAKRIEEINKKYEAFMPKMMEMSFSQMKPLILIIPALAVLTPLLRDSYPDFVITLPFSLPVFVQQFGMILDLSFLSDFNKFLNWRDTFGSVGWFWVCVLFFNLGKSLLMAIYNKIKPSLGFLPSKNAISTENTSALSAENQKSPPKPGVSAEKSKNSSLQNLLGGREEKKDNGSKPQEGWEKEKN